MASESSGIPGAGRASQASNPSPSLPPWVEAASGHSSYGLSSSASGSCFACSHWLASRAQGSVARGVSGKPIKSRRLSIGRFCLGRSGRGGQSCGPKDGFGFNRTCTLIIVGLGGEGAFDGSPGLGGVGLCVRPGLGPRFGRDVAVLGFGPLRPLLELGGIKRQLFQATVHVLIVLEVFGYLEGSYGRLDFLGPKEAQPLHLRGRELSPAVQQFDEDGRDRVGVETLSG